MVRIPPFHSIPIGGGPCSIHGGCKNLLIPLISFLGLFFFYNAMSVMQIFFPPYNCAIVFRVNERNEVLITGRIGKRLYEFCT